MAFGLVVALKFPSQHEAFTAEALGDLRFIFLVYNRDSLASLNLYFFFRLLDWFSQSKLSFLFVLYLFFR